MRGWEESGVNGGGIDETGGEGMLKVKDVSFALCVGGIGVPLVIVVLVGLPAIRGVVAVLQLVVWWLERGEERRDDEMLLLMMVVLREGGGREEARTYQTWQRRGHLVPHRSAPRLPGTFSLLLLYCL